jgi:hypothetical protein
MKYIFIVHMNLLYLENCDKYRMLNNEAAGYIGHKASKL